MCRICVFGDTLYKHVLDQFQISFSSRLKSEHVCHMFHSDLPSLKSGVFQANKVYLYIIQDFSTCTFVYLYFRKHVYKKNMILEILFFYRCVMKFGTVYGLCLPVLFKLPEKPHVMKPCYDYILQFYHPDYLHHHH